MRDYSEYRTILRLWAEGCNKSEIALITRIPRATIRDCITRYKDVEGLEAERERATLSTPDEVLNRIQNPTDTETQQAYAYLLGMYLGDGYIVRNKRIYFLRIACDSVYPGIINACAAAIQTILPNNKVGILPSTQGNWTEVVGRHKFWPEIFPQHGAGPKHMRKISLEPWQQEIVDRYPLEVFRGLYHSDGSRFQNIVKGKDYPRYQFTNYSSDILGIFTSVCDSLGIHWTAGIQTGTVKHVYISQRKDVAYLDEVVGPKY